MGIEPNADSAFGPLPSPPSAIQRFASRSSKVDSFDMFLDGLFNFRAVDPDRCWLRRLPEQCCDRPGRG